MKSVVCFHCWRAYTFTDSLPRKETCGQCGSDLHCCKNCTFYDPSAPKECREPVADPVRYKDRANFCDYFDPKAGGSTAGGKNADTQDQARKAWDDLFKK